MTANIIHVFKMLPNLKITEIRRELKKGFLGYQCMSLDGFSSTNRSTDLTKGETRSICTTSTLRRTKYEHKKETILQS